MPPPLDPARRTWHITFGTYATRLHNDPRPTVDRRHNQLGSAFPPPDPSRQQRPAHDALYLTVEQRRHIEAVIPDLCTRGGWTFRACAAPRDADHVHALLDADPAAPPKAIRQWLKRWLGESLTQTFGPPPRRWWAEGGSTKPVTTQPYLDRATPYINNQRTTPLDP